MRRRTSQMPCGANRADRHVERDRTANAALEYLPVARSMSRGDRDLQQELMVGVIEGIQRGIERSHIIHRLIFRRKNYYDGYLSVSRFGVSIDTGKKTRRPDRQRISIEDLSLRSSDDPSQVALFSIGFQRFKNNLEGQEVQWWAAKEKGLPSSRAGFNGWSSTTAHRIKTRVREKFRAQFET